MPRKVRLDNSSERSLALRADAEAKVTRWRYTTGPVYDPRPHYAERLGMLRVKHLRKRPAKLDGIYQYGFDDVGRLLIARRHGGIADQFYEELFEHQEERIDFVCIGLGESKVGIRGVVHLERGRVVAYERTGATWKHEERYFYEDAHVTRIETKASNDNREMRVFELSWNGPSLQTIFERAQTGKLFPVYEALRPDEPRLEDLVPELTNLLVEHIPKVVAAAAITEPAYCVALVYDAEGSILPPELGVGLERQRMQWIASKGNEVIHYVWSSADYERFDDGTLQIDNRRVYDVSKALLRSLHVKGTENPAIMLLARVAAKLNQFDWSAWLPVTDDFVVIPLSLEGGFRSAAVNVAIPAERRKVLRRKKLL